MLSTSHRYSSSSVISNYCTYPVAWSTSPKTHCGTVFPPAALEKRVSLPTAVSSIETMCPGPPMGAKFFIRSSEQTCVEDSSWKSFVSFRHLRSFSKVFVSSWTQSEITLAKAAIHNYFHLHEISPLSWCVINYVSFKINSTPAIAAKYSYWVVPDLMILEPLFASCHYVQRLKVKKYIPL